MVQYHAYLHTQSSVDVSVWNIQWLLGTLMGVDHTRQLKSECSSRPTTVQEVDEEEEEDNEVHIFLLG